MERTKEKDWALSPVDWAGVVLLIIGGLTWGLVGLYNFNVVTAIFGEMTFISRMIYVLVGLAGVWSIVALATHLHQHTYTTTPTPSITPH
jgi:uncharacterized protein